MGYSPKPTFVPYTTLFRSDLGKRRAIVPVLRERHEGLQRYRPAERRDRPEPEDRRNTTPRLLLQQARARHPGTTHSRDRKSTRLNSSHLGISYAVFCLKKK